MNVEDFPPIETFKKLPKRVVVKGGAAGLNAQNHPQLSGIVINNSGQTVVNIKVHLVTFDDRNIPLESATTVPDPDVLPQGQIGSFLFTLPNHKGKISNSYLYATWAYDDKRWTP